MNKRITACVFLHEARILNNNNNNKELVLPFVVIDVLTIYVRFL